MKKKILIISDEENTQESLKLILGDYYNLILTDDDAQALDCLENASDIGLVFMDIKMPKMNGLEILAKMKKEHPRLKVIMITGYKSAEKTAEAIKLGACSHITKPFKKDEILKKVGCILKPNPQ